MSREFTQFIKFINILDKLDKLDINAGGGVHPACSRRVLHSARILNSEFEVLLLGRAKAGVPQGIEFATKPEIALKQIRAARAAGVPDGVVLADVAYGNETAWRESLSEMQLKYCVGVQGNTSVWAAGSAPLPAKVRKKKTVGRPAKLLRRNRTHQPMSVKALALSLPSSTWRTVSWREGTNQTLRSRFAGGALLRWSVSRLPTGR